MKVTILDPKGYCGGVSRAISLALQVKKEHPTEDIYILGMLVHNLEVIDNLKSRGFLLAYNIDEVKPGSILIFTAHGHDIKLDEEAQALNLKTFDAICPIVSKNLQTIQKELHNHHQVIYIGYRSHPETIGALSLSSDVILYQVGESLDYGKVTDESPLVINQTTLNYSSLKDIHREIRIRLPFARFEDEICHATRTRQEAIINLPLDVDAILVVGGRNSSNTLRLLEIAKQVHPNIPSYFLQKVDDLPLSSLQNKNHIVISSGASTPPETIDAIYNRLINLK